MFRAILNLVKFCPDPSSTTIIAVLIRLHNPEDTVSQKKKPFWIIDLATKIVDNIIWWSSTYRVKLFITGVNFILAVVNISNIFIGYLKKAEQTAYRASILDKCYVH